MTFSRAHTTSSPEDTTPTLTVHQVRSYDPDGRELCRLDPDTLTPRCTG